MGHGPLTEAEKRRIIELGRAQMQGRRPNIRGIARQLGRSPTSVRRTLHEAGLEPGPWHPTVDDKDRILELYRSPNGSRWNSIADIAEIVGWSSSAVHNAVAAAGISRTRREAAAGHTSEAVRQRIIHVYLMTGWTRAAIADRLRVRPKVVCDVLRDADVAGRRVAHEAPLQVALYVQGRSALEVADLTDRSHGYVKRLLREAGVMRSRQEATTLMHRRRAARTKLGRTELQPMAERWINGAEVEDLADEINVPADLMWDALAGVLSIRARPCTYTCPFACIAVCAQSLDARKSKPRRLP